jgi:hypothetical protein
MSQLAIDIFASFFLLIGWLYMHVLLLRLVVLVKSARLHNTAS